MWMGLAISLLAVGGYGRAQLFPYSDLDLLFVLRDASLERAAKTSIWRLSQHLWDAGTRVAATTRTSAECLAFNPDNVEFTLSLLDSRFVAGDALLAEELRSKWLPPFFARERQAITHRLLEVTRARHARYGNTLFHLEPNVKECPGGFRDAHSCDWLLKLGNGESPPNSHEFTQALSFLTPVRCFLHFRGSRDQNTLDWRTQDEAARLGMGTQPQQLRDSAGWMQLYFRHARVIARRLERQVDSVPVPKPLLRLPVALRKRKSAPFPGLTIEAGRIALYPEKTGDAMDPETVLDVFESVAGSGARPSPQLETAIEDALPLLSAQLEEGPALWRRLRQILTGEFAGTALRSMHTLGVLELILPEFHGIDALVVRDAYHRYTVDEHTFVLIDALHALLAPVQGHMAEWARRFGTILRQMDRPDLLYLAALLHDTGKGRAAEHTPESVRLAEGVLSRLELDSFESALVLNLIRNHLEMSAALRRDIFDMEIVRSFAVKVETPEALRMLALFTFADIQAVNPDALTPWKAENLWRLYIATSNYLDRNIDEERVDSRVSSDLLQRIMALVPGETREVLRFLEGFPQRYLRTRSPEHIRSQFGMSKGLADKAVQLDLQWRVEGSEMTLVTPDQRLLFARIAGVLSGWGMNIITADAFSNSAGIVVDSFRFTDTYRTLERNPSERDHLLADLRAALADEAAAERIIAGRRRLRRREPLLTVATSLTFDAEASSHSTVLEVVAQDHPGLLYAISSALSEAQCNIEVAVIDTEGDTAIDVFYLTRRGEVLDTATMQLLRESLLRSIEISAAVR